LELEDMAVRLVRPPNLAGVHGYRWTVRFGATLGLCSDTLITRGFRG